MQNTITSGEHVPSAGIEEMRERLRRAGWRLNEECCGPIWQVDGSKGENNLLAAGQTQAQALWNACLLAGEGWLQRVRQPTQQERTA
jgi:hypothetical protein